MENEDWIISRKFWLGWMSAVGSDQAATAGAGKAAPVLTAAEKQTPPPSNLHHNTPNNSTLSTEHVNSEWQDLVIYHATQIERALC